MFTCVIFSAGLARGPPGCTYCNMAKFTARAAFARLLFCEATGAAHGGLIPLKLPAHAGQFTPRITRRRSVRLHPNPIPGFSCKLWFGSLVIIKRTPGPRKSNLRPPVCWISRGVWVQGCWLPFPNYAERHDAGRHDAERHDAERYDAGRQ